MKNTYIRIAIIGMAVLLIICLGASLIALFNHKEAKHMQQIKAQEVKNQHIIDSLVEDHRDDMANLQVISLRLMTERDSLKAVISGRIDKIKIAYDKKVDNVALLPPDSLLMLLTGQVGR